MSQFTPDGSGIDRDALLFAAGRVSARANRVWIGLTVILALSQTLTLWWLWPRPVPVPVPAVPSAPEVIPDESPAYLHVLGRKHLPPQPPCEDLVPDAPPLPAFCVDLMTYID